MAKESTFKLQTLNGTVYTYADAWVASQTDTTATIQFRAGARLNSGNMQSTGVRADIFINGAKVADKVRVIGDCYPDTYYGSSNYTYLNYTYTVQKTQSTQSIAVYVDFYEYTDGHSRGFRQTLTPSNVSVPAKTSYTISYNANGGSGAPSNQTKWYGTALTLTYTQPTRDGYTFAGWNTAADGSGTSYASGASYNANAAATLYAVWRQNTWTVTYMPNGGIGDSFTGTKVYGEALQLATSGFVRENYTLYGWNTSANNTGTSYALGSEYTLDQDVTLYAVWRMNAPAAPTSLTATRNSDTSTTVSWVRPANADATWQSIYVYRSVNGATFGDTPFVTLAGTAVSWTDNSTTANNSYRYLVRAYNDGSGGQQSTPAYTETIYNTPAAPISVTARRKDEESIDVILDLSNPANTASGFDVEYSQDRVTWVTTGMTVDSSVGSPATQITLGMTVGGDLYFRVRNTRDEGGLVSAWTAAATPVPTLVAPNAPRIISPAGGGVSPYGNASSTDVDFVWEHSSRDGTPQTAAQLRYSIDGGSTWLATVQISTAQTYRVSYPFAINQSVTWQVRTKGAAADYGAWSAPATFAIYKKPTLTINSPTTTIIGVPINFEVQYTDESGSMLSGKVTITNQGSVVYTEPLLPPSDGVIQGSIFASEFLPQDGETYTIRFDVTSTTTFSVTEQVTLPVHMEAPHIGTLEIKNDPDTGYVSLIYGWDDNDGGQLVDHVELYRITKNGRIKLAESAANGNSCLDMYAPLNTHYEYLLVTIGQNLAINQREFPTYLNTGWWFVYWNGKIARAKWNPNGTRTVGRAQRTRVHYIGRQDPVSYDGTGVDDTTTMDWQIVQRDYAQQFLAMVREIGRGIYKSGDGEVYHADFDNASASSNYRRNAPYGTLNLQIIRIDGEQL